MSNHAPQVSVVIVTYESRSTVGYTLDALYEAYDTGFAEVIIVDNASADDTAGYITENFPWTTLICSNKNLGFGRGCNLGFQKVRTPYLLILNPDAVITLTALQTLVDFMAMNKQVGIAAPAIVEGGKGLQAAGLMTTPASLVRSVCGYRQVMTESQIIVPNDSPFQTSWVCGAIMLIRTDLFQMLGGFDPRFFLYFEETDLCRRATQLGFEIWALGEAVTEHIGGASAKTTGHHLVSSCISEHFYRSRFYYLVKHFGWIKAVGSESFVRAIQLFRVCKHLLTRCPESIQQSQGKQPFLRFPQQPDDI